MAEVLDQTNKTKAAVLSSKRTIEVAEKKLPGIGDYDVLVKVMAVGVCGSDVHYYEHGKIGSRSVQYPHVLGHECAGVIVNTGTKVTKVTIGDRVAVEPGVGCGACEHCVSGHYNLCSSMQFLSSPPVDGAFSEYIVHPEHLVFPIPAAVSFSTATLVEPLSVGIHACRKAELKPGQDVMITGLGPIGLTAIAAAKEHGAEKIIVSDIEPSRLELALKMGATHTINAKEQSSVKQVEKATGGKGIDVLFETSGQPAVLAEAPVLLKKGGKLVPIGFPVSETVPLDLTTMLFKEISLRTVYRYTNTYPLGISIVSSEKYDWEALITDFFPLNKTGEALEKAKNNKSGSIKIIVYPHL